MILSIFEQEQTEDIIGLDSLSAPFSFPRASYDFQFGPQPSTQLSKSRILVYAPPPPSTSELLGTLEQLGLPRRVYRDPFYSKKADIPDGPREYAGLVYRLKGDGLESLEEWQANETHIRSSLNAMRLSTPCSGWEYAGSPPSVREVKKWLEKNPLNPSKPVVDNSQVDHPSVILPPPC